MKCSAIALCLLVCGVPLAAQHPTPALTAADVNKLLIGTWAGPYSADHGPPGGITLNIARDTAWKVSMELLAGGELVPTTIRDFKVEGTNVAWSQDLMGMSCRAAVVVTHDALRGETECGNGHVAIGYLLRKKVP